MHFKWLDWLNDVDKECEGLIEQKEVLKMCKERQSLKVEIIHLQYEAHRSYLQYCADHTALMSRITKYKILDRQLSYKDGRAQVLEPTGIEKPKKKKAKDPKKMFNQMSNEDKQKLLKLLQELEDDI